MNEVFKTFRHGGVQYLAVARADGVGIVDSAGKHYGSWYSADSFLEHMKKQPVEPVGHADLAIRSKVL